MLQWVIKMNEIINIKDYLKENFDIEFNKNRYICNKCDNP